VGCVASFCLDDGRTRRALELRSDALGRGRMSDETLGSFAGEELDENKDPGCLLRSDRSSKITLFLNVSLDLNAIFKTVLRSCSLVSDHQCGHG